MSEANNRFIIMNENQLKYLIQYLKDMDAVGKNPTPKEILQHIEDIKRNIK